MAARPESPQIAAGIDEPFSDTVATQRLDSAIDGKTLGDATEVDFHSRIGKTDPIYGEELNAIVGRRFLPPLSARASTEIRHGREQAEPLQCRRDRDVEHSARPVVEIAGGFEHLIGPIMNLHWLRRGAPVEPADIAIGLVKAHQSMHRGDGRERGLDSSLRRVKRRSRNRNLDECAEQRTHAANAGRCGSG
jgi:hypothetical protein